MPSYISLINWTDQGVRAAGDTMSRAEAAREVARGVGGELTQIFWTVGAYDLVIISEFPDDESLAAFLLRMGVLGNIRTNTLRAHGPDEMTAALRRIG
ncbi:MAG: GYD domain-containing protein [Actinocatenispora sp.]